MNEHDYPPSPAYYQHSGADARDLVTPEYWRDSALVHLFRAGRKDGETVEEAVANAFLCLALWFQSQGLEVPHYSAALAELRAENARLGAELQAVIGAVTTMAMTPRPAASPGHIVNEYTGDTSVASGPCPVAAALRPTSPTLDTPATSDEWTDEGLCEWLTAKWGEPVRMDHDRYRNCIVWPKVVYHPAEKDPYVRWRLTDGGCPWTSSRNIARHFGATKPEPATSDEWTDEELMRWMDQEIAAPSMESDAVGGVRYTWHDGRVTVKSWMNARRQYKIDLHGMASRQVECPTLAARILGAATPADPFAGLLTIETDEALRAWLTDRYKSRPIDVVIGRWRWELSDDGGGRGVYFDPTGPTGPTGPMSEHGDGKWSMTGSPPRNMTATEAARALHRILTEPGA